MQGCMGTETGVGASENPSMAPSLTSFQRGSGPIYEMKLGLFVIIAESRDIYYVFWNSGACIVNYNPLVFL